MNNDIKFMNEAIKEAKRALKENEVPIGCVLVKDNKIISRAHNKKEKKNDCTAHAEILAIQKASKTVKNWRLLGFTLYVTLEPCAMCASAIQQARISKVVFALEDKNNGAIVNGPKIYTHKSTNKPPKIETGVCEKEAKSLIHEFFLKKRIEKK